MIDVLPREIRAHVKLPRIARGRDPLGHTEKAHLVSELRLPAPPHQERRLRSERLPLVLDPVEAQEKGAKSSRRHFRLTHDRSAHDHRLGFAAELTGEPHAGGLHRPHAVQKEKRAGNEEVNRERVAGKQG